MFKVRGRGKIVGPEYDLFVERVWMNGCEKGNRNGLLGGKRRKVKIDVGKLV